MALLYNTDCIAVVLHVLCTQLKVRNCSLSTIEETINNTVANSGIIKQQLVRKILQLKALGTRRPSFDLVTLTTT